MTLRSSRKITPSELKIADCHYDPANYDDEADDDLPSINELLAFSSKGIPTGNQNSKDTPQHLEAPVLNISGSRLGPNQSRSEDSVNKSQGTRDRPVVLENNESDTPVPEATALSVSVDAGVNPPSEVRKGRWWDVEDECYINDDLRPIPPLEQEGLASTPMQGQPYSYYHPPGSSQDQISQYGDSGTTGGVLDEAAPHTLPQPLGENGRGGSDENASELEKDMLLAFEEQEKSSSAPTPSSRHPQCHSAEPLHPQIDPEHH